MTRRRPNLILVGLNRLTWKHVYAGTVTRKTKLERRRKNRAARTARQAARR